jgi:hypothetical protein
VILPVYMRQKKIASFLEEPKVERIQAAVKHFGRTTVLQYVQKGFQLFEGGEMTCDRLRKRTAGGCFFYVLRKQVKIQDKDTRRAIFG